MASRFAVWALLIALHTPAVLERMVGHGIDIPPSQDSVAGVGVFFGGLLQIVAFVLSAILVAVSKRMRRDPVIWLLAVLGAIVFVDRYTGPNSFHA